MSKQQSGKGKAPTREPEQQGDSPPQPTEEQRRTLQLEQVLQSTRTELAVLKQLFAEKSVEAAISRAECNRLIPELQHAQQTIQNLTEELQAAKNPPAEETEESTPEAPQAD